MKFLIKLFIKDYNDTENPAVRKKYGAVAGITGIVLNIILFVIKLALGVATASSAIIADSFNNLSDSGSSLISVAGTHLGAIKPDKEHPFGHGRYEYISSLIVSFVIILAGFELLKASFSKIINPTAINFTPVIAVIMIITALIKLWMFFFNRYIGRKINSTVILAAATDSIFDCISTTVVIISASLSQFTTLPLDGFCGSLVSLFIMFGGYKIAKNTVDLLLGRGADEETVEKIKKILFTDKGISGIHELIVHDYGPGRILASVHVEVSANEQLVPVHERIDKLEKQIFSELGISTVIHIDPTV